MELCEDGDLDTYLKKRDGRLLEERGILLKFVQIRLGLQHVHSKVLARWAGWVDASDAGRRGQSGALDTPGTGQGLVCGWGMRRRMHRCRG